MLLIKITTLMMINAFVVSASAAVLTDPTRPVAGFSAKAPTAQGPKKNKLTLNVIKLDKNQKVAMIDGRMYRQGQQVGQDRIREILLDRVILGSGKELYLFGHSVVSVSQ